MSCLLVKTRPWPSLPSSVAAKAESFFFCPRCDAPPLYDSTPGARGAARRREQQDVPRRAFRIAESFSATGVLPCPALPCPAGPSLAESQAAAYPAGHACVAENLPRGTVHAVLGSMPCTARGAFPLQARRGGLDRSLGGGRRRPPAGRFGQSASTVVRRSAATAAPRAKVKPRRGRARAGGSVI
jgi:hypothetical protein